VLGHRVGDQHGHLSDCQICAIGPDLQPLYSDVCHELHSVQPALPRRVHLCEGTQRGGQPAAMPGPTYPRTGRRTAGPLPTQRKRLLGTGSASGDVVADAAAASRRRTMVKGEIGQLTDMECHRLLGLIRHPARSPKEVLDAPSERLTFCMPCITVSSDGVLVCRDLPVKEGPAASSSSRIPTGSACRWRHQPDQRSSGRCPGGDRGARGRSG
jgi:hypothetical protein